ncbi:MAG TPA: heme lyase NrfEFG subunit NrfE, partial [Alphaproteobacteria bacterium]|nr:heme lyase NrfEFG subunit NrfE [Alphaproteobacteria bacterium]
RDGAAVLRPGQSALIAGYTVQLRSLELDVAGPNYTATRASIAVIENGQTIAILRPERWRFPGREMQTTEAAISTNIVRDVYVAIGEPQDGSIVVNLYVKPLVAFIWAGAVIMAFGGLLSLADRRYRIGVGARDSRALAPAE